MSRAAFLGAVLTFWVSGFASSQAQNADAQPLACVAGGETRDLYLANKLIQPFRVVHEASLWSKAEAIDIQLCRFGGTLVYDLTLLSRDGQVFHRLVNAASGTVLGSHKAP